MGAAGADGKEARVASAEQEGSPVRSALLLNTLFQPVGNSPVRDWPRFRALIISHTCRTPACAKSPLLCLRIVQWVRCVFALVWLYSSYSACHFFFFYFGLIVNVCSLRCSCGCFMVLAPMYYHTIGSVLGRLQRCQLLSFQSSEKSCLLNSGIHSTI